MREKWYRNSWVKALLAAAAILSFTALFCCGTVLSWLIGNNHYTPGESRKGYASSRVFAEDILNDACIIVSGLRAQELLVEKTPDGDDLLIDLQAVLDAAGENYAYGNVSGLAYTVADLKKWAQEGWSFGDEKGGIIVCHQPDGKYDYYYYNDFVRNFTDGKFKFVVPDIAEKDEAYMDSYTLEILRLFRESGYSAIPSAVRAIADAYGTIKYVDFWNYGDYYLKEEYVPAGAKNLLDVVNNSETWNGRLNEAISCLAYLLDHFSMAQESARMLETFREGNTNIAYLYVDTEDRRIGTNRAQYESYEAYEESIAAITQTCGAYCVIRPTLSECVTTLNGRVQEWQQTLQSAVGQGNFVFAIGVDTAFPVADGYAEKAEEYSRYALWVDPLLIAVIFSLALLIFSSVWLVLVAGRLKGDEELHLCFFDRWYTELAVLLTVFLWVAAGIGIWEIIPRGDTRLLALAGFAAETAVCALFLFLSLARRVKAGNLWRDSLLRFFLLQIRKCAGLFMRKASSKVKVTLLAAVCLLLLIAARVFCDSTGSDIVILSVFGALLLVLCLRKLSAQERILEGLRRITAGELQYKISLDGLSGEQRVIAEQINRIGDGLDSAVESSVKNERMKTELITNVSHDIKTPLTSIINYVDLLKRENLENQRAREYIDVLEKKAQRLKILTEDVVEASKISTGNITLEIAELNFAELTRQVIGEFRERFEKNDLLMVTELPEEPVMIRADGRRLWRVLENVFGNAAKYAMPGTRVYVELSASGHEAVFSIKNISAQPLNFSADELTERFIRGDVARNTEGSGLGLSIAKSLTELQGGVFRLFVDGDLFRASVVFPCA